MAPSWRSQSPLVSPTAPALPLPPTEQDEAVLVARAKRDPRAFACLYDRYVGRIYHYCDRRLGSPEAVEDATSAVFAKALAALSSCRNDSFRAWLFAIAHNVVSDAHRSDHAEQPIALVRDDLVDPGPSPEDLAVTAEAQHTVGQLLAQLSDEQRQIIELRLAGLTDREIAQVLGRSRGAVRTAQYRAVLRLRDLLGLNPTEEVAAWSTSSTTSASELLG